MPKAKVAVTIDAHLLEELDQLVARQRYPSRSRVIEEALAEKLARGRRTRLAREAARLDPSEERGLAEEGMAAELETWPA